MKILRERVNKQGRREVVVELATGEEIMTFEQDSFYRLGGQVDDIVRGHVVTESEQVTWCSITQAWV